MVTNLVTNRVTNFIRFVTDSFVTFEKYPVTNLILPLFFVSKKCNCCKCLIFICLLSYGYGLQSFKKIVANLYYSSIQVLLTYYEILMMFIFMMDNGTIYCIL